MLALLCFPAYLICSLFLVAAAPMRKIQGLAPLNVTETVNLQRYVITFAVVNELYSNIVLVVTSVTGMNKIVLR